MNRMMYRAIVDGTLWFGAPTRRSAIIETYLAAPSCRLRYTLGAALREVTR